MRLAILFAFAVVHFFCVNVANSHTRIPTKLHASFTKQGIDLLVVHTINGATPVEAFEALEVRRNNTRRVVQDLPDLEGCAQISTPAQALSFVRLRTSPWTWLLWQKELVVEIIDASAAKHLDSYGLQKSPVLPVPSGFLGVVSTSTFKQMGIHPASVATVGNGYRIRRWLLNSSKDHNHYFMLDVEESVSPSGGYTRKVIRKIRAPYIRENHWLIPMFE